MLSKSRVSELTAPLSPEYEAVRTRDRSGYAVAYLFLAAGEEPGRRWGSKTGVFCGGASWAEGRKGLLPLSTAKSERSESRLEGLRDVGTGGLQPPVPSTTEGAPGLTKALEVRWPKSLRSRCGVHPRQNLQQQVPPPAGPEGKALRMEMRDAPTVAAAERRRPVIVNRYPRDFPAAGRCLLDEAEASLKHLSVPQRHQPSVRTSNLAARALAAERRRTKVIPPLGDAGSVTKLVLAVWIRVSERWGKKCGSEVEQHQLRSLRRPRHLDDPTVRATPVTADSVPRRSAASAA